MNASSSLPSTPSAHSSNAALRATLGVLTPRGNFGVFKMKVRACMLGERLLHVLDRASAAMKKEGGTLSASAVAASATASLSSAKSVGDNERVYTILVMCLDDAMAQLVMHEASEGDGAGVWRALLNHFERQTMASRLHTRSLLHKSKMATGEQFDEFKSRVQSPVSKLESNGEKVSEGELIYVILDGLPAECGALKASLTVQDNLSFEGVCNHVRAAQEKLRYAEQQEEEEAVLFAAKGGRRGGRGGRREASAPSRSRDAEADSDSEEERDWSRVRCFLCMELGHSASTCSLRKGRGGACFRCGKSGHDMFNKEKCEKLRQMKSEGAFSAWDSVNTEVDYTC